MTATATLARELGDARLGAYRASRNKPPSPPPPPSPDPVELLDVRAVARILRRSIGRIRLQMGDGDIPGAFRPKGEWHVRSRDLAAALASRAAPHRPVALPGPHDSRARGAPVSLRKFARMSGESVDVLRAACEAGHVPGAYRPLGDWRIRRADLISYIRAQLQTRADMDVSNFMPEVQE